MRMVQQHNQQRRLLLPEMRLASRRRLPAPRKLSEVRQQSRAPLTGMKDAHARDLTTCLETIHRKSLVITSRALGVSGSERSGPCHRNLLRVIDRWSACIDIT